MADDVLSQALAAGGSIVAGGGASALVIRLMFASIKEQLVEIATTLKAIDNKGDERHERVIERLALVEAKAQRAHDRLDDEQVPRRRGRR
jgi:hypothetical protein